MLTLKTATITLILVMDPLGNVPMFLSALKNVDSSRRKRIILRESLFAFLILTLFLFFGQNILKSFGVSESALGIAGGILLFLIAIKMIFPPETTMQEKQIGEPFIVPLAIPLLAGPSAIAMVLLFAGQYPMQIWEWFVSLLIASTISTLTLLFSNPLRRVLGAKGLMAMERLMGMILTTVAIQMLITGISNYFHLA